MPISPRIVSPLIGGITPTEGSSLTTVVITGSGFTGTSAVTFNGVSATSFTIDSDVQITAIAPVGVSTGAVEVSNIAGSHSGASVFISLGGNVTTFAGDGVASAASFNQPRAIVFDSMGSLFVIERNNHKIRKIFL